MNPDAILAVLTRILRDVLADDSIVLTLQTRREDVPNWDSFGYITFIVATELQFGVKFKLADIDAFADVGAIVAELLQAKAARA